MKHVLIGSVLLSLGALGVTAWWLEFGHLLRGLVPFALVLIGLAGIGAGFRSSENVEE